MIDPVLSLGAALLVAWVFASAAAHKLKSPAYFAATLSAYEMLPGPLVPAAARILPVVESAVAIGILWPGSRQQAAVFAVALFLVYGVAMGVNLARGRNAIDCGCGDPGQHQPLSAWLLLRNATLAAIAASCILPTTARATGWLDWAVAVLAAAAGALALATCNQLLANREQLANLRSAHGHA